MSRDISSSPSLIFLSGLGIGAMLALLFAPKSGEETREWLTKTGKHGLKEIKVKAKRVRQQAEDLLEEGSEKLADVLEVGAEAAHKLRAKAR